VAGVVSQALARKGSQAALDEALQEIRHLNDRLADGRERGHDDGIEMRRDVKILRSSRPVVSESSTIKRALAQVEQVAPTPATVLLLGETGAGKEVFAQAIHDLSPRHHRHMVRVSCAAIPPALIESELFGRERGAYTGALSRQIGRFEAANQSTLFLDEIGDLPLEVQVKLLRVLQERVIERLGSTQQLKVDVRIIAATNHNLEQAVTDGTFREDLFYRLNVFPIVVPALRERVEDIPGLVWAFIDEFSRLFGKSIESVSKDSLRELQGYSWPGNVRELRNAVERAVVLGEGDLIRVADLPPSIAAAVPAAAMHPPTAPSAFMSQRPIPPAVPMPPGMSPPTPVAALMNGNAPMYPKSLRELEKEGILAALAATRGNKAQAAAILEIDRSTLYKKLKEYGIEP
jgi:transcriptional regulator with GAF, ATPase, and Fis domain